MHEYAQTVGVAAAHNVTEPWRVATAIASDAARHIGNRILDHEGHVGGSETNGAAAGQSVEPAEYRISIHDQEEARDEQDLPQPVVDEEPAAAVLSSTAKSGDIGSAGEGMHCEIRQDVILRLETLTVKETKYAMSVVWIGMLVAYAALFAEFGVKLQWDSTSRILHHDTISLINVVVGCFLACQLLRSFVWLSFVTIRTWQLKRAWKRRRARNVGLFFIELIAQMVNVFTFIAANAYAIHNECSWLGKATPWLGLITWTCWNTIILTFLIQASNTMPQTNSRWLEFFTRKSDTSEQSQGSQKGSQGLLKGTHQSCKGYAQSSELLLVVDGPLWQHLPKFLLWLAMESTQIALCSYQYYHLLPRNRQQAGDACRTAVFVCQQDHVEIVLTALGAFWYLVYIVWFCKYLLQELRFLQRVPYTPHRISNIIVRLNTRMRLPFVASFLLCFILWWGVKIHSCFSYVLSWQGLLPMQIIETSVLVAWSFVGMPKDPKGKPPLMQVWLQEFCWSYKSRQAKLRLRNQSAPDNHELVAAPMFCFEDAMKLLYWTVLIYDMKEAERTSLSLEEAKELYALSEHELLWEPKHDTKCLLGFGHNTIVVAFRGTASLKNASADVQAWQAAHPPVRGRHWMGRRPRVHAGFLKSWLAGGLKDKVVARVLKAIQDEKDGGPITRVLITGHSLGGALATLCAFDIAAAIKEAGAMADDGRPIDVCCYTFGAPRTGNRAFRNEFNALVPNCWGIINDQVRHPLVYRLILLTTKNCQAGAIDKLNVPHPRTFLRCQKTHPFLSVLIRQRKEPFAMSWAPRRLDITMPMCGIQWCYSSAQTMNASAVG
ncbi:TPA: hypothetical protein ACH3X2_003920 [Trebouxia sp. C0005]